MHTVWGFAFFTLETIIFMITGTFIGEVIYEFEHDEYETTNLDFIKAALFYLFVMLVRLIVLFIQYPIMNQVGYRISWKEVLVLAYGGLRGSVALALGMIIILDEEKERKFRSIALLFIISVIFFSTFINGSTIKLFVKCIGFQEEAPMKHKMRENLKKKMIHKSKEKIKEMKESRKFTGVNWDKVD